jgi:hypothetical protein
MRRVLIIFNMAILEKKVLWNMQAEGFLKDWIWQYGEGPFEVVEEMDVTSGPHYLGGGTTKIEIPFEPGKWYRIKLPETAHNYRPGEIMNCEIAIFHSKWFS